MSRLQAVRQRFDAAGIDLDAYDFGASKYDHRCPACGAELEQILPFVAGGGQLWHWQLKGSWLQEQLRKAKVYDQQHQRDESAGSGPHDPRAPS